MTDQPAVPLTVTHIADEWNPSKPGVIMWAAPDGRIEARAEETAAPRAAEQAAS